MRAAVLRGPEIVVDTVPDPEPGAGQVLVKTLACGICGTDLHMLQGAQKLAATGAGSDAAVAMAGTDEFVMGHEFAAEIVDYGPGSEKRFGPASRVCSMPIAHIAGGIAAVGFSPDHPGGFGELMVLSEDLLLEIPNGLSTAHAALTEPMAVGAHAVAKSGIRAGDIPVVIGCGPVGLAVIASLRIFGEGPIVAADFSPARRALAAAMGADVVVDPAETSPYEKWEELAPTEPAHFANTMAAITSGAGRRPAVIFECVGLPGVIQQAIDGAPRGARLVVVGVCMEPDRVHPFMAINKELSIQFALAYGPGEFAATLGHIAEGRIDVGPLVTGSAGVTGVADAFEALANPEAHAKILVEPWRD